MWKRSRKGHTDDRSRGRSRRPGAPPDNPDALVEEINRTREELGNTVEALTAKVDVKARAQQKATECRASSRASSGT